MNPEDRNNIFPSKMSVADTNISSQPTVFNGILDSCECLVVTEDSTVKKKNIFKKKWSMKGTKKWFRKKFSHVFKGKEQRYEKLLDQDD